MRRLHHPNVLLLHVSFVHKQTLWMVEPYIAGGSMLNIMKYAYPEASSSSIDSITCAHLMSCQIWFCSAWLAP
jgi:serine/threonine protein kinase